MKIPPDEYLNKLVTVWLPEGREATGECVAIALDTLDIKCDAMTVVDGETILDPTRHTLWRIPRKSIVALAVLGAQ